MKRMIGYDNSNKTKITDLNVDCLLMIFDCLDVSNLLAIAETNEPFRLLATDVYKRKYSQKSVDITQHSYKEDIIEYSDSFNIEKFDQISKLFQFFGHLITKVEIHGIRTEIKTGLRHIFDRTIEHGIKDILKLVNNRTVDLKELILSGREHDPFKYVDKPFSNVETLSLFEIKYNTLSGEHLKFNELFPNVRRLNVNTVYVNEINSLIVPFKQLEHLSINSYEIIAIGELIKKNSQIRNFTFCHGSIDLMRILCNDLPNLEYLEINFVFPINLMYNGNLIKFETVKHLKINSKLEAEHTVDFPKNIFFEQLEVLDLQLRVGAHFPDEWIEFIGRNVHLKKLKLDVWYMFDEHFTSLIGNLPNLVEAFFVLDKRVTAETIITFLDANEILKKLELLSISKNIFQKLKIQIEHEWKLTEEKQEGEYKHILIERK